MPDTYVPKPLSTPASSKPEHETMGFFTCLRIAAWQWLTPLALIVVAIIAFNASPEISELWHRPDVGIQETLGGLVTFTAFLASLYVLFRTPVKNDKALRIWVALYAAGVFFYFGEDVNWGQYYLNLTPSDYLLANNKEQEINLHNMSSWFNQKPRLLVELWVWIAGIAVPLGWNALKRVSARIIPSVLWPDRETLPVAVLAFAIGLPKVLQGIGIPIGSLFEDIRWAELQEFCFSWFMLVYIWGVGRRMRNQVTEISQ